MGTRDGRFHCQFVLVGIMLPEELCLHQWQWEQQRDPPLPHSQTGNRIREHGQELGNVNPP